MNANSAVIANGWIAIAGSRIRGGRMNANRNALRFFTTAVVALALSGCGDEYDENAHSSAGKGGDASTAGGASAKTGGAGSTARAGSVSGGTTSASAGTAGMNAGGAGAAAGVTGTGGSSSVGGESSVAGSSSVDGTAGSAGRGPRFHVFLLLGQSNMVGYPKALEPDRVEDERVKVLGYDECAATGRHENVWDTAAPPLHNCWTDAIGPGDYFAKTLLPILPAGDTIGLVPCAISGEKIETFLKVGGTKYDWIIQRARLAQQAGGIIEGLLFHQGESNNTDSTWPGKVNTLVTDLRTDLGLGNVPFLAGELLRTGDCAAHNVLIDQLPSVVTNAYVVSSEELTEDTSDTTYNLHFSHGSQVTLGQRYADTMKPLLDW